MKFSQSNSTSDSFFQRGEQRGFWDRASRSQNIMIPIELDQKSREIGFYPITNQDLPVGGQNNLNEITGTPFKVELAGMAIIASPVLPNFKQSYIKALISLADSVDQYDHSNHSQDTEIWAVRLAEHISMSAEEVEQIHLAARLHDIGKAVLAKELLTKPGPLNEEEWAEMRRHPEYSAALMETSALLNPIRSLVRSHHEQYDGAGYPDQLVGREIPLGARILSVADAFSSLTNGRVYRQPVSYHSALDELCRNKGKQFDPILVDQMVEVVRMHLP